MKYEPPKLPLPKTGKTMQIYIANDKRSAALCGENADVDAPAHD